MAYEPYVPQDFDERGHAHGPDVYAAFEPDFGDLIQATIARQAIAQQEIGARHNYRWWPVVGGVLALPTAAAGMFKYVTRKGRETLLLEEAPIKSEARETEMNDVGYFVGYFMDGLERYRTNQPPPSAPSQDVYADFDDMPPSTPPLSLQVILFGAGDEAAKRRDAAMDKLTLTPTEAQRQQAMELQDYFAPGVTVPRGFTNAALNAAALIMGGTVPTAIITSPLADWREAEESGRAGPRAERGPMSKQWEPPRPSAYTGGGGGYSPMVGEDGVIVDFAPFFAAPKLAPRNDLIADLRSRPSPRTNWYRSSNRHPLETAKYARVAHNIGVPGPPGPPGPPNPITAPLGKCGCIGKAALGAALTAAVV